MSSTENHAGKELSVTWFFTFEKLDKAVGLLPGEIHFIQFQDIHGSLISIHRPREVFINRFFIIAPLRSLFRHSPRPYFSPITFYYHRYTVYLFGYSSYSCALYIQRIRFFSPRVKYLLLLGVVSPPLRTCDLTVGTLALIGAQFFFFN